MRAFSLWAVVFLVGISAARAEGEAAPREEGAVDYPAVRVGLGIGLASRPLALLGDDAVAGSPATLANVQVPFYLGRHLRLEPEFGMISQSGGLVPGNALLGRVTDVARVRTHVFRFLVGLQWATEVAEDTVAYVGPKVGLQTRSVELDFLPELETFDDDEIDAVDFWLGVSVGGEAFLTRNFSLGVEAGLYYLNQGESSLAALQALDPELPDHSDDAPWTLSTQGSIAARIYFL